MAMKMKAIWNKIRPTSKTFKNHSQMKSAKPIAAHSGYGARGGSTGAKLSK